MYIYIVFTLSSIQFSRSVMSSSLWPYGLQQTRHPCPQPTPRDYSDSCPLSQRCHPTISSSLVPLSSCPQSFPASGSFQMNQLFPSGSQNIGASASTSVYSCHLFLISSASVTSILFLSFIEPIFAWSIPLVSLIFLKRSLVFPFLLFFSISLHWSLRKASLSLLAILWNSAFG